MKIQYDSSVKLAGIGLVPWTRLGPERWFPAYKIASLYGWDMHGTPQSPEVVALSETVTPLPTLPKLTSQHLLDNGQFQGLLTEKLPSYTFVTYKPVRPPQELLSAGQRFVSMDQTLTTTLENKAQFRQDFADLDLPFPAFRIMRRDQVRPDEAGLRSLLNGWPRIIVQDEMISGGRGTFVVKDVESLQHALSAITALGGGLRLVISDMIEGAYERSLQCVVTRYGTFVGHLQKQIIANPLLANLNVTEGDRFCGGEISRDDPMRAHYSEIRSHALAIGQRLQRLGYRGIFSLDCLIDQSGKVYVLEINPRLTGMTPLVTALYRDGQDIPFYLLHLLETAGIDYTITDDSVADEPPEGGLLVLHSLVNNPVTITTSPSSGLYDLTANTFMRKQLRFDADNATPQAIVQQYTPPTFTVKPGGRLLTMQINSCITDAKDALLPHITTAVQSLMEQVKLKEIKV